VNGIRGAYILPAAQENPGTATRAVFDIRSFGTPRREIPEGLVE
jgi:hypothetical protein